MTEDQIRAAGAEAVKDFPPLADAQVDRLAAILRPIAEQPEPQKQDQQAA